MTDIKDELTTGIANYKNYQAAETMSRALVEIIRLRYAVKELRGDLEVANLQLKAKRFM